LTLLLVLSGCMTGPGTITGQAQVEAEEGEVHGGTRATLSRKYLQVDMEVEAIRVIPLAAYEPLLACLIGQL
jgi:hypothetical protein